MRSARCVAQLLLPPPALFRGWPSSVVAGRDRLGIDLEMDDRRLAGLPRRAKAAAKSAVFSTSAPKPPKARGIGGEIRILQRGRDHAAGIFALLMHADGAVDAVVGDTTTIGRLYCTAVAKSWPVIRKSPSPATHTTVRSG